VSREELIESVEMAYKQRWLGYFKVLDANNSGFIDPGDAAIVGKRLATTFGFAEGSPQYHGIVKALEGYLTNLIKDFDINKDGKVSREELIESVDKLFVGKGIEHLPGWWIANLELFFKAFDTNNNGELSLEEVTHIIKKVTPHESAENIAHAYKWAQNHSHSKGKYDANTLVAILYEWATSPAPTPEAEILMPFFRV